MTAAKSHTGPNAGPPQAGPDHPRGRKADSTLLQVQNLQVEFKTRRGTALGASPNPPLRLGCPTRQIRTALPLARQRGGLKVDGYEAVPRIGEDLGDKRVRRRRAGR